MVTIELLLLLKAIWIQTLIGKSAVCSDCCRQKMAAKCRPAILQIRVSF